MQTKGIATVIAVTAALTLLLAASSTVAGPPVEEGKDSGEITLAATVASRISYQGRLTDAGGNPLNGSYNLVFQLWDGATAGSQVGGDIVRNNVPVQNGLFTVELDVPQDAFNGQALWLRVQVNGQWLSPRQELLPVPYALSLRPGAEIRGDSTDPAVTVTNAGLLGTALKAHGDGLGLDALGQTGVYAVGWTVGVDASGMTGVRGQGDVGVRGDGLTGVHGESEMGYGVVGVTNAPMAATAAAGVYGESMNVYGVEGFSQFGVGVFGRSEGGFGAGMGGSGATGVYGIGGLVGVSGYTESDDGTGVAGTATGYNGKGVEGTAEFGTGVRGEGATGVAGYSFNGTAVYGEDSGPGFGVYGACSAGWAGFFAGHVNVTGSVFKAGGSFKIDHPLDPENKYLYHSFVESPDMKNIYDGVVVLDESGEAWVKLPDWFEALNRDFRYQLTCIGGFAPVYIAEEISGNRFKIAGGKPGMKVSWQVTGIRHDPYAEAHRIPVEEDKPPEERDTYLHPIEYGKPETLKLDYRRNQALFERSEVEPEAPAPAAVP